jgi:hypothetical protein
MQTKIRKPKRKTTVPKMIRFPADLVEWLTKRAADQGIRSEAELVRQIAHEYRQRIEQETAA